MAQRWRYDAACRGMDVNIFFSKPVAKEAVDVCDICPVSEQCAEYAIVNENFGYFGGLSDKERYFIRKKRGIPHPQFGDHNMMRVLRNRSKRDGITKDDIVHGTVKGYRQERQLKMKPCDQCLMANRDKVRQHREKKKETA